MLEKLFTSVASAIGTTDVKVPIIPNTTASASSLSELFTKASNIIALVAGALAFVYLVYSGIMYLTAGGNPDAAKKGQQGILNAIIGLVIIVAAWAIINAVVGSLSGIGNPNSNTTFGL